jgi:hypothetical protein
MRSKQSMMDISYGSFHISALDKKRKKWYLYCHHWAQWHKDYLQMN